MPKGEENKKMFLMGMVDELLPKLPLEALALIARDHPSVDPLPSIYARSAALSRRPLFNLRIGKNRIIYPHPSG